MSEPVPAEWWGLIALGGFVPVIAVGGVIAAQELFKGNPKGNPPLLMEPPLRGEEARRAAEQKERNEEIARYLWRWAAEGRGDEVIESIEWYHGFRDHRSPEQIKREGIDRRGWTLKAAEREAQKLLERLGLPGVPDIDMDLWATDRPGPRTVWVTHRREDACGWAERTPEPVQAAIWKAAEKVGKKDVYGQAMEEIERAFGRSYVAVLHLPLTPNKIYTGLPLVGPQNADTGMQYIPPEYIVDIKPCLKVRFKGYWGGLPQFEYLESTT